MKIYHTVIGVIIAGQILMVGCSKNHPVQPGQVTMHIGASGKGRVYPRVSDTLVDIGSVVTVVAVADSKAVFVGWFGTAQSTQDTFHVAIDQAVTIEARFLDAPADGQLVKIPSYNAVWSMGSSSAVALREEKPPHPVRFTYGYYIDKYEITQHQYQNLMGVNPAGMIGSPVSGLGENFPVFNVSWYDAALYCNARSKAQGYDTVYSFTAQCVGNEQCPYVLENLTIHYDRFGYRLPTEAEWEFACRAGKAADYSWGAQYPDTSGASAHAWYRDNSGDSVHPVGSKQPNEFGCFDMAGNVGEWVDDWLGAFSLSAAIDPVGPTGRPLQAYEDSLLRPVRGGAYNLGSSFLRSSCRRGPYDAPAKLIDKSIGFRCALGAFFPGTAPDTAGQADTSGVTVCDKSKLVSFFGTSAIRCVFVKQTGLSRTLWTIDFGQSGSPVTRLLDSLTVYNPVISPNGNYIAYSSKGEGGFSGPSTGAIMAFSGPKVSLRRSNASTPMYIPRWWVDKTTQDTFLIYSDNTVSNLDTVQWKKGKTFRLKVVSGGFTAQPDVLCDTGSFYGGLSFDGNFLATGFKTAYMLNLRANDLFAYFSSGVNGTGKTIQVCNVTISPGQDDQDRIMFLDFGTSGLSSSVVGKPYGLHAMLFTDNTKDSTGWYEKPAGYDRWEDPEWTNHPRFAAAMAQKDADGQLGVIYAIDLQNHLYCPLASGMDIADPCIWIDPRQLPPKTDPYHNFAKYDVPAQLSGGQMPLCMKLKLFWKQFQNLQCAVVGSSPAYFGIDPAYLPSVNALNMATITSYVFTSYTMTTQYVIPQASGLKVVIMGLDAYSMTYNQKDPYLNGLPRTLGYQFDQTNNFWKSGIPPEIREKIAAFDSSQWTGHYFNGYTKQIRNDGWGDTLIDGSDYRFEDSAVQVNVTLFKTLSDTLGARGVHLLVVNFPENPLYKQTSWIGRFGPSRQTYAKLDAYLRTLEQHNTYFHFYDANNYGDHDYTDAEALDCNHLDNVGARKLTRRLDSLVRGFLP